jgi:protein-tyrosine phosphatase
MAGARIRPAWVAVEGAANMRDLGGLPLRGGGVTASRVLLRADNLQGLTERDVAHLVDALGVGVIVDLRTEVEIDLEGPGPLVCDGRVAIRERSLLPEAGARTDVNVDGLLPWQGRRLENDPAEPPAVRAYLGYLRDRPDSVVAAVRDIAYADAGVVVHCAAGKDRTGVVCALALETVGVKRDAVIEDYVATAHRLDALLARLRSSRTYAADLNGRPAASHVPRAETMARLLDVLDERHGGAPRWLTTHGFGAGDVEALRRRLSLDPPVRPGLTVE